MYCKQVKFVDTEGELHGGILVESGTERNLICGCCGFVFDSDAMEWLPIVEEYKWLNISNEIMRE